MKKIVVFICWVLPVFCGAQVKTGIMFSKARNWNEVLEEARREKKNIFIDAFATWCGPCKKMDSIVYTDTKIANYVNHNFITVKIQFDKTDNDSKEIKGWYPDAKKLQQRFQISAFPMFLFMSPSDSLIHKSVGYQDTTLFMSMLKVANNPGQNYSGHVKAFEKGKLVGRDLLKLALQAKDYHDDSLALQVARIYKKSVIDSLSPDQVLEPDLIPYFTSFYQLFSVKDSIIKFMFRKPFFSDSALKRTGYSRNLTDFFIYKNFVDSVIKPSGKYTIQAPDWTALHKTIASLYDVKTSGRLLLNAKLEWYNAKEDWPNVVKYYIEQIETNGIDTKGLGGMFINNLVYDIIFKRSNDPAALKKAASWMEFILKTDPESEPWLDTYANVLHKLGKTRLAIQIEKKALAIAIRNKNQENITLYTETLQKIENNEPTW